MNRSRFPWAQAFEVACDIRRQLRPGCMRIEIAGSLRRREPDVGDIEILYIPAVREETDSEDLFSTRIVNCADDRIRFMLAAGILDKRMNIKSLQTYGEKNKLLIHVRSGIPVDLFAATEGNWFNYLVCRTGPAEQNKKISIAAQRKGYHWNPYGSGFTGADGQIVRMESEAAVFTFVGMTYRQYPPMPEV